MRMVSRAEGDLLRTLDVVLHRAPPESLPEPREHREWTTLSPDAIALIRQRLTAGCVEFLARRGWRRERFLGDGRPQSGRLWQRHVPKRMGLTFSTESIRLLISLASHPDPHGTDSTLRAERLTLGDRFLAALAVAAVQKTPRGIGLTEDRTLCADGLCALTSPGLWSSPRPPEFGRWLEASSVWVLEALQPWLAARWESFAMRAGEEVEPTEHHSGVLDSYFRILESAGRRDLARFLLIAGRRAARRDSIPDRDAMLPREGSASAEDRESPLVGRLGLERLREWERWARTVGYFDEGYAEAQFWLSEWERLEAGAILEAGARQSWLEP